MSNDQHGKSVATVVAAMQTTAHDAKAVVSGAQDKVRKAATAVAAAVRAESGVAKAKVNRIRRAAVAEAKEVFAGAEAKVTEVGKAVKGAVQKALGRKARTKGATTRKVTARSSKPVAKKNRVERKAASGKPRVARAAPGTGPRRVARKTKR